MGLVEAATRLQWMSQIRSDQSSEIMGVENLMLSLLSLGGVFRGLPSIQATAQTVRAFFDYLKAKTLDLATSYFVHREIS